MAKRRSSWANRLAQRIFPELPEDSYRPITRHVFKMVLMVIFVISAIVSAVLIMFRDWSSWQYWVWFTASLIAMGITWSIDVRRIKNKKHPPKPAKASQELKSRLPGWIIENMDIQPDEEILVCTRLHWKDLLEQTWLAALLFALSVVSALGVIFFADTAIYLLLIPMAMFLIGFGIFYYKYAQWKSEWYVITNHRYSEQINYPDWVLALPSKSNAGRTIRIAKITQIDHTQGLIDKYLKCGSLLIESESDKDKSFEIRNFPRVRFVKSTLNNLIAPYASSALDTVGLLTSAVALLTGISEGIKGLNNAVNTQNALLTQLLGSGAANSGIVGKATVVEDATQELPTIQQDYPPAPED